ncbi:ribonuclease p mrp subunit [Fusarium albosuccineum]|uniref:Ribonuclease p mrp subunit n=1 Tax=Fusarium albosuccineum TaxID=1237068 RepID=A0A8H4L512_9HYPO|nr:ribonuclease p mrp subunit [Fusarium albosuccineum]
MTTMEPHGLGEPLYDPPSPEDAKVDIVFVHGLNGDRVKTWTSEETKKNPSVFWPRDLLPNKCENARILSFGYNAAVAHFFQPLFDGLKGIRDRTNTADRPIMFVCHSLGGLVCANAVAKQYGADTAEKALVDKIRGMIFLGTPFAGSKHAPWALIVTQFLRLLVSTNQEKLKHLDERSEKLVDISNEFLKFIWERQRSDAPIQVAFYFEEYPTKQRGLNVGFIVDRESAVPRGFTALSIPEDHSDMCKFEDEYRSGFISISDNLCQWIRALDKGVGDEVTKQGGINIGSASVEGVSNVTGVVSAVIASTATDGNRIVGSQKVRSAVILDRFE